MKSFFVKNGKLNDGENAEHETDERKPTSARRWTDAHLSLPTGRQIRRIQKRRTALETKKYRRSQVQSWFEQRNYREIAAVKVLRHLEEVGNLGEGGLRLQLIEDGKLSPTEDKILRYENQVEVVDGEQVEMMVPVIVQVPRGHTPREILAAAGIDEKKLAELYTDLVEDEQNTAELRRAERRQAAQAKREAAVTA